MRVYPNGILALAVFLVLFLVATESDWGMATLAAAVVIGLLIELSPFMHDRAPWRRRRVG
jgi:hypothetical protein